MSSSTKKATLSEEDRPPTRLFVEVSDAHTSVGSASDLEGNLQSELLEHRLSWSEVDSRINARVAPLATQLETLMQPIKELSEGSSKRSTEGNVASERSKSSGQRSDMLTGARPAKHDKTVR